MDNKIIFVHVPKTGGTTLYAALNNTFWNSQPNFNYRHILEKNKSSNAGDIFDLRTNDKYLDYSIISILRHPVDKLISEYYFFKEMETLNRLIKNSPKNIESYIKEKQTQNATINFLKGRRLYDTRYANRQDLDDVIKSIEKLNIHIGLLEEYPLTLEYFSKELNIKWNKKLDIKRTTFIRPELRELDDNLKELILENNKLDLELYNYCKERFYNKTTSLSAPKINLVRNKYNDVLPYALNACLFGFCLEDKKYISQNFNFFKELTFYLLKEKELKDGRLFTKYFNSTYLNALKINFPNSEFHTQVNIEKLNESDPLEDTILIAKKIDNFFSENSMSKSKYYQPMKFSKDLVPEFDKETKPKDSFFKGIFKKK